MNQFRRFAFAFVTLVCWIALAPNSQAQFYTLNPGDGLINAISDNGIATGSFQNSANQYFMWEVGVGSKVDIGGAPAGSGVGGQASISNDGTRIGGTSLNANTNSHEMSWYNVATGVWTPVGGIGGSSGSETSSGWGMSGDGQSMVGLGWVNAGQAHGCHWRNGVMTDLGTTNGTNSTRANSVNCDGTVIGGWQDGAGRQGAVWVNGTQELIFDDAGDPAQEVSEVSDDGRFATGIGIGPFNGIGTTFRYDITTDTFLEIENLAVGGDRNIGAGAITADGSVIGGGTWGFGQPAIFGSGFVWEQGVGTMSVEDYLIARGASGWSSGFVFSFVSAISSDGSWIGGWGYDGSPGNSVSWVVKIPGAIDVAPDSFQVTRGVPGAGTLMDLTQSDNLDLSISRDSFDIQARTELTLKTTSPTASPTLLDFTLEASVFARSNVDQSIELYDYDADDWALLDLRSATRIIDSVVTVSASTNLSRFVQPGTNCMEARIRFVSDVQRQQFTSNIDHTFWTIQ